MVQVYWLEQTEADVPPETRNDWLSPREAERLAGLRVPKRRAEWRLGRWTAKRAVAGFLGWTDSSQALASIEILPAACGAPEVVFDDHAGAVTISLSHRAGRAACAVSSGCAALGCDLEIVEPRSDSFLADWFTREEQELVGSAPATHRFRLLALLWSAKESALKAIREGLRLDTRSVAVAPAGALERGARFDHWRPLEAGLDDGRMLRGWWQQTGSVLRTLVSSPPSGPPILLQPQNGRQHQGPV